MHSFKGYAKIYFNIIPDNNNLQSRPSNEKIKNNKHGNKIEQLGLYGQKIICIQNSVF